MRIAGRFIKEVLDRLLALLGLVVLSPVLLALAGLVLLSLGRPVFFRQLRPGLHGRPFELMKFRTMLGGTGPDEARLTPLGRFLRASSLDELPELWNVLLGEMSLVGPRPLLMQYLPRYSPRQARRHEVKPGVTGWAQVNGRNALTWDEKFELDVWYVDNWSLWLDVCILGRTFWQVLRRDGISHEGHATMTEFMGPTLFVYGASGHGKVVADAALASHRFAVRGFLDDDPSRHGQVLLGLPVEGGIDAIQGQQGRVAVALGVGSNAARLAVLSRLVAAGHTVVTVVHPSAVVASGVVLGDGTFVAPLAAVHTDARLGRACIVNTGAVVEHDNVLGDGAHVSPNAALGGNVRLGDEVHVGLGAVVLPGVTVGARSVAGAGAVVIEDVPEGVTVFGVPARLR